MPDKNQLCRKFWRECVDVRERSGESVRGIPLILYVRFLYDGRKCGYNGGLL